MKASGKSCTGAYLYGYQGSERDNDLAGGTGYTTYFRALDPRIGRWQTTDPKVFPWQSPYCSMDGNPIGITYVLGDEGDPENNNSQHTVQKDETLYGISKDNGVSMDAIKDVNPEIDWAGRTTGNAEDGTLRVTLYQGETLNMPNTSPMTPKGVMEQPSAIDMALKEIKQNIVEVYNKSIEWTMNGLNSVNEFVEDANFNLEFYSLNSPQQGAAISTTEPTNRINADDMAFTGMSRGLTSKPIHLLQALKYWIASGNYGQKLGSYIEECLPVFSKNQATDDRVNVLVISSVVKGNAIRPTEVDRINTNRDSVGIVKDSLNQILYRYSGLSTHVVVE